MRRSFTFFHMENNDQDPAKPADLEKNFPFRQAKAWEQQDALHSPVPDRRGGFRLPETIRVERVVPERE